MSTSADFSKLSLKPEILSNLSSLGYSEMTPIQEESLGLILDNKDIIAQAKTGSGKTAAFGLGLLNKVSVGRNKTQALVMCPTRELADQVAKELRRLARGIPNLKILTLCGGTPVRPQIASLAHGCHCIVGTPGRIMDHLDRGTVNLKNIQSLVLDEADRMLDMGFSDDIKEIIKNTPNYRQTLFFSATYPENIQDLSEKYQKNPVRVHVDVKHESDEIEQCFFEAHDDERVAHLAQLLSNYKLDSTVVFCKTKQQTFDVARELRDMGISAQSLNGDLEQRERDQVLALFANKCSTVLVATDVAARGIDVKDLQAVINFDLSKDPETHVHRIGRTGRAGKKGFAFSFFSNKERFKVKAIEEYLKKKIQVSKLDVHGKRNPSVQKPSMIALRINGGKKNKLRPTDILGTLTSGEKVFGSDIGKIDIFDFHTFVAVSRKKASDAENLLSQQKIKGRHYKTMQIVL